jgi:hypothetical protein
MDEDLEANARGAVRRTLPLPGRKQWLVEQMGCLLAPFAVAAVFLLMPVLFHLGEGILGGRRPAAPLSEGSVVELVVDPPVACEGRPCRVFADWVEVEDAGAKFLIPRERVRQLRIRER